MTTRQYLSQINRIDFSVRAKLAEIEQLETMATSITVQSSGDRVQSSGSKDRLGNAVAKIVDIESEIEKMVSISLDQRKYIIRQIESLENDDYYAMLSGKYVAKRSIVDIGKEIGYAKTRAYSVFNEAIANFEERYGEEYLN